MIHNWNNKPAAGFGAADNNWTYQSVHRNELFKGFKRKSRLHDVLSVVNRAATQDLRVLDVWPLIREVLSSGPAPDARSEQAAALVDAWRRSGASRLDRDLDGKIDDPGAAVLDQTWDGLSEAVLRPVLGDLAAPGGLLGQLVGRDNSPRTSNGSAYGGGWYGYVDKDLRTLLGKPVRGRYSRVYCGAGDLAACRASLWAVIQQGADALAAAQGPDPAALALGRDRGAHHVPARCARPDDALDEPADLPSADGVQRPPSISLPGPARCASRSGRPSATTTRSWRRESSRSS